MCVGSCLLNVTEAFVPRVSAPAWFAELRDEAEPAENMRKRNVQADLPHDIILSILQHASTATLSRSERVCRAWRDLLSSAAGEKLWSEHCAALWRDETQWLCDLPPSRHVLIHSLLDAARDVITAEELSGSSWRFRFVGPDLAQAHLTPAEQEIRASTRCEQLCFAPEGVYTSTIPGAPSASRPLPWKIASDGRKVRIASYPPLLVSRTADWGWCMRNQFVEFYTETVKPLSSWARSLPLPRPCRGVALESPGEPGCDL